MAPYGKIWSKGSSSQNSECFGHGHFSTLLFTICIPRHPNRHPHKYFGCTEFPSDSTTIMSYFEQWAKRQKVQAKSALDM